MCITFLTGVSIFSPELHTDQPGSITLLHDGKTVNIFPHVKDPPPKVDLSSPCNAEVRMHLALPLVNFLHVQGMELWDRDTFCTFNISTLKNRYQTLV
jgi:hypothetical protein